MAKNKKRARPKSLKEPKEISEVVESNDESKDNIKESKWKRGKKLCKDCAFPNPINCKFWQKWGHEFYRKQSKNILKQIAKDGNEYYTYLDTISYNKGSHKKLSMILNKTRVFTDKKENVGNIKKRDLKRMQKGIHCGDIKELEHFENEKVSFWDHQTIHNSKKEFDHFDNKHKSIKIDNESITLKYEDNEHQIQTKTITELDTNLHCISILGYRIHSVKWLPVERFIHPNLDTIYYCSVLAYKEPSHKSTISLYKRNSKNSAKKDLTISLNSGFKIFIAQYCQNSTKLITSYKISWDTPINSITQLEWLPPMKNKHKFNSECVWLINSEKLNYAQLYTYDKKGFKTGTRIILAANNPNLVLSAIKTWRESYSKENQKKLYKVFMAIGDSQGNVRVLEKTELGIKCLRVITKAHDMEITGIEVLKYCKTIKTRAVSTISKDGFIKLWDLDGSTLYPIYEVSGFSKRWVYDIVWDHSQQSLMFNVEGRFGSYNVLHLDNGYEPRKSQLIKENTTSIASRHTSKLILISCINGWVYSVQKQINVKKKVKNAKADVIFRIDKAFAKIDENVKEVYQVSQNKNLISTKIEEVSANTHGCTDDFSTEDYLFTENNTAISDVKYNPMNSDICSISLRKDLVFIMKF